jgi:hypothetical protein
MTRQVGIEPPAVGFGHRDATMARAQEKRADTAIV